jgi:LuxR family transcriptional regulator, maltose regulon positive regulatory protein
MRNAGGSAAAEEQAEATAELLESKLRPPQLRAPTVPRTALLSALDSSGALPVILVSAPPGYGKTTLLAQWAADSERPFAWVSLDDQDNDPVVMLSYVAAALDRIFSLDSAVFDVLTSPGASLEGTIAPRLGSALGAIERPFVLALDDLHAITNPQCLDAIDVLIDHIPEGSQMALCGRGRPLRRLGALRTRGIVLEIGPEELRMDESQAGELLQAAQMDPTEAELAEVVERTEGWPAGLYLAAISTRKGARLGEAKTFRGDDRFVADYLRSELLTNLPADELRFLTQTAVLDRMCGPLCDAVLESSGSAEILDSLERSNLFVIALDRNREWYRYHHLFRELLRAELERAEPGLAPKLLTRAAGWCEDHREHAEAIGYAQAAADVERVAALVTAHGQSEYQRGRAVTVERWLDWLGQHESLERVPEVAALGAWLSAIHGQPGTAERWADAAQQGVSEPAFRGDQASIELLLALLRASRCRQGVEQMLADAQLAVDGFGRTSSWWPTAAFLLALARLLAGDETPAEDLFAEVAETAAATGAWNAVSMALAEQGLLAIRRGDWSEAEAHTNQASLVMHRSGMEDYPLNALVYATAARVAVHRNEDSQADDLLARAQRLRPRLTHALCALSIHARLELARTYAARVDIPGARTLLREAGALLRRGPDFGTLAAQAEELDERLDSAAARAPGASTLTTAELRLLPLLATHLTFPEIGARLYVSRNTVKSQVTSVYRKLDVTSRSEAVNRARDLGLI